MKYNVILFLLLITVNVSSQEGGYPSYSGIFYNSSAYSNLINCDNSSFVAKYWQYRENLKHFVAIDRSPQGCIGDGIGQDENNPCVCSKHGYSLPATSINQESTDFVGLGDYRGDEQSLFFDPGCGGQTGERNNYLEIRSETPHQMGWYWVMLATEYELLGRNGQYQEQQKTLEELFLGLQAYRRLDITAQCLVEQRYTELEGGILLQALCPQEYLPDDCEPVNIACNDFSTLFVGAGGNCFTPITTGFSGFFIREDATQELETLLNDPNDPAYNIDMVKSDYAFSNVPPCNPYLNATTPFCQTCYNVKTQNFMSQDQLIVLMMGLAAVKRYIPESAVVSTCDGKQFKVLEIAQKISEGIVTRLLEDNNNAIIWPGSEDCCEDKVKFSLNAGGQCLPVIWGLIESYNYINDRNIQPTFKQRAWWGYLGNMTDYPLADPQGNGTFFTQLSSIGWDWSEGVKPRYLKRYLSDPTERLKKEILFLFNNQLYPGGENLPINKEYFQSLLCSAPCGGPCFKSEGDCSSDAYFDCPNIPNWLGQRWEGNGEDDEVFYGSGCPNRLFNGLDYMALHNLYMLEFPEDAPDFYNPQNPEANPSTAITGEFLGSELILGSSTLCVGQKELYQFNGSCPSCIVVLPFEWYSSNNIQTSYFDGGYYSYAKMLSNSQVSYLGVKGKENRTVPQFISGTTIQSQSSTTEVCTFDYRKPIASEGTTFSVETDVQWCEGDWHLKAISNSGVIPLGSTFTWKIEHLSIPNSQINLTGKEVYFYIPQDGPSGAIRLTLTVNITQGECTGEFVSTQIIASYCTQGRQIIVSPNPTQDDVIVSITKDYDFPQTGLEVEFVSKDGGSGHLIRRVYSNSSSLNLTNLPDGLYEVRAEVSPGEILRTNLVIERD